MTKEEFDNLIPKKSMVYNKRDGVGYTYMGMDENKMCRLYGLPIEYEDYLIRSCFYVKKEG